MSNVIQALRSADPERCSTCFLMPYCREQIGCMAHGAADSIEALQAESERLRNKLAAYEDAEKQGRLVVLPCKVGDTVYCIKDSCSVCQHLNDDGDYCGELARCGKNVYVEKPFELSMFEKICNTVFITREAAEARLREMEGRNE